MALRILTLNAAALSTAIDAHGQRRGGPNDGKEPFKRLLIGKTGDQAASANRRYAMLAIRWHTWNQVLLTLASRSPPPSPSTIRGVRVSGPKTRA